MQRILNLLDGANDVKVAEYLEQFRDNVDDLILDIYEEMDELVEKRRISTVNGMISLFREVDAKWRKIAQAVGADEDLFEDLVRHCDPSIFRPCFNTTLIYNPIRY